jgi:hypothetical protein
MKRRKRQTKHPKKFEESIAGQGLMMTELLVAAVHRGLGKDSPEAKFSQALPIWCHNIADIFVKTILKNLVNLDLKGQFDPRKLGRLFGMLLRVGVFVGKEVEPILKREGFFDLSKTQQKKLKEFAGIEHLFPVASQKFKRPIKNENQLISQSAKYAEIQGEDLVKKAGTIFKHLWNQPVEVQHNFLCGIPEGFSMFLDNEGQFTGDRGRTNLYMELLARWNEIAAMQKSDPPKSRRDLHQWLMNEAKIPISNNEDWFDHLCDEIGLVMKSVGRKPSSE